ncbi:MAG: GLPGLI family protein [Chitinophagaceae bacterium]
MKIFIFIISFLTVNIIAVAQATFLQSGRVVYERRFNQHSLLEMWDGDDDGEDENVWKKEMQKQFPRFVTTQYELIFTPQKTMYRALEDPTPQKYMWDSKPSENDIAIQEVTKGTISIQRDVFEKTYLLQDSIRHLKWRITDETRTIAGFECRKAVTKICDSVVVVAFYCDEIPVSSGPETMGQLPGLILGLAVPRLHTTWFATSVQLQPLAQATTAMQVKQKGSKVTWAKLQADLKKAISDWGKAGNITMWRLLL